MHIEVLKQLSMERLHVTLLRKRVNECLHTKRNTRP